jgi:hypothetical protein
MPRWISVLVGIAAVALAIGIAAKAFHPSKPGGSSGADLGGDSGAVDDAGTHSPSRLPSLGTGRRQLDDLAAPPDDAFRADSGVGTFDDGTPVPPLPRSAPRQVRFGVVLVSYAGAQAEASGGHPATPAPLTTSAASRSAFSSQQPSTCSSPSPSMVSGDPWILPVAIGWSRGWNNGRLSFEPTDAQC